MKQVFTFTLAFFIYSLSWGQCTINPNAIAGLTLTQQGTNHFNNSGVAYNPLQSLYYGVRAGNPTFPLDTWSSTGTQLYQTTTGFDWRGMWWNPNLNSLEGNGYSTYGLWRANLDASGWALNTGTTIFTGQNQPDAQSCGDLDYVANEILYYWNGGIYRYSRATNAYLGNVLITGTPVALSNLNWTTLMYTGCAGMEVALLDYVNKRIYLYNKSTGAFVGMSQLPAAAVTSNGFRTSWANGLVWLWNLSNYTWYSYNILTPVLGVNLLDFNAEAGLPGTVNLNWSTTDEDNLAGYEVQRSVDGVNFTTVASLEPGSPNGLYNTADHNLPEANYLYYRLRITDANGAESFSKVEIIELEAITEELVSVFPNPATEVLNVCLKTEDTEPILTRLFDVSGKLVLEEQHEAARQMDCSAHSISDLSPGVYFLSVTSGTKVYHHRVVIGE